MFPMLISVLLTVALLKYYAVVAHQERAQMAEYASEIVHTRARLPFE